jgi:hypothetical protein
MGASTPPVLESRVDLEILAENSAPKDPGKVNGSSITLLLEWQKRRVLLTGNGFADELHDGLAALDNGEPVELDVIKTPHHGNRQNMTKALVQSVDCPLWVFSSDGTTFRHPDAQATARILHCGSHPNPTLAFNAPSTFNGWWNNNEWRELSGYQVRYGTIDDGHRILSSGLAIEQQPCILTAEPLRRRAPAVPRLTTVEPGGLWLGDPLCCNRFAAEQPQVAV